ncbi:uncharacterized protein LOC128222426 [Mya arenaria]|uniref:uncharacterized protein LOC128222426 n=1 Tax=Mya arenaria TaxID=6604 RepID=UPI0022E00A3B|nr:uncharacterized protein LOC128222426 [Mya arenaria]
MILKFIIGRIGIDKTSGEELLGEILKSNTCLLVLDGLDEWQHPERCHSGERIPHVQTSWENCTLLITTRPYKLAELKIGLSKIGKHVMVNGVSNPEKLVENILSRLNDLPSTGMSHNPEGTRTLLNHELCIKEIQENNLWHFSECPIVLAHIVWLSYKRRLLTDMKLSDLYETLLKERCSESCDKERCSESCDKSNSSPRSKYKEIIPTLSKIAFAKLFAEDENQTIVFEIDAEENVNFESQKTASLESGIISCTNVPGDSPQYYFLHKTVQEYLAALCISKDIAKCCSHIKHTYKNNRRESGISLSQILIFLCSIDTKAAEELSKEMNELFTDFCDRYGYPFFEARMLQDTILQGQKELDRSDYSGRNLCLKHIYDTNAATVLNVKTNQSRLVSLEINEILTEYKGTDNVLDLKNLKSLKYLRLWTKSVKDIIGLNLSHLVECSITFETPQLAPNLTSTFYNNDIECLQTLKKLVLSNLTDIHWLHKDSERKGIQKLFKCMVLRRRPHRGSEQKGILDLRRLGNLESSYRSWIERNILLRCGESTSV